MTDSYVINIMRSNIPVTENIRGKGYIDWHKILTLSEIECFHVYI